MYIIFIEIDVVFVCEFDSHITHIILVLFIRILSHRHLCLCINIVAAQMVVESDMGTLDDLAQVVILLEDRLGHNFYKPHNNQ